MSVPKDLKNATIRIAAADPATRPGWLIWSHKWNLWHRRGPDGGAYGYTGDIEDAGLFTFNETASYRDGDNEVFSVVAKATEITARREVLGGKGMRLLALARAAGLYTPERGQ